MKTTLLFLSIFMLSLSLNAQDFKVNVSGRLAVLNVAPELQIELPINDSKSYGLIAKYHVEGGEFHHQGIKGEGFFRSYAKQEKNKGLFTQVKLGYGYFENNRFGDGTIFKNKYWSTVGGSVGIGKKFYGKGGLTAELYTGFRYYTPPQFELHENVVLKKDERSESITYWYLVGSFPLELNFKVGWEF
jgi:hypothetical protein